MTIEELKIRFAMGAENLIQAKTKAFAIRIIKLYKYLTETQNEYVMSKQLLRAGTSIGANTRESINAQSKLDFINKLNIALKETDETQYWLELLSETNFLTVNQFQSIYNDSKEIAALLVSIIKTTKKNLELKNG